MSIYDKASLVLIPSGTKTSKVYSQKPVSGDGDFTFSRSTAATRVNADGNIEKETQNLLVQSNSFDTTWSNTGSTLTSGQSGYDGTSNAWLLHTSSTPQRIEQNVSINGVSTFSVYGKSGTANYLRVQTQTAGTDVFFDVANGTIASQEAAAIDATITDVGNGWYRCSMSVNENVTNVRILVQSAIYGVNVGDNIYIQDAQLEQGLVAREYIETTTAAVEGGITDNVPRLDYTDSSCPALLLEPQRTNLATSSEYFEQVFTETSGVSWEHNSTTSPEGVNNASKLSNTSNNNGAYYVSMSFTDNDTMTASIFAKQGSRDVLQFGVSNQNESRSYYYRFNLSEGTASYYANNGGMLNGTGSIEDYGNGWYRCIVTATFPSSGTTSGGVFPRVVGTGNLYLYGLQVEKNASYATSYIPTYGSAVTRNKEQSLTTLPVSTGSGWSVIMDWSDANFQLSGYGNALFRMEMEDSSDVFALLGQGYTGQNRTRAYYNGYFGSLIDFPLGEAKVGFTADGSTIKTFVNGSLYNTSTIAHNTDFDYIRLNADAGTNAYNKLLLFQSKLTDQEMIDLTTI